MAESKCAPVVVEGAWSPAQTKNLKNKLQVYFQSRKKSGGGECRVETVDGAPRAAVFFSSEEGECARARSSNLLITLLLINLQRHEVRQNDSQEVDPD